MDWIKRLQDEFLGISEKLHALEAFQLKDVFKDLKDIEKRNLAEQMSFMRGYKNVLERRINYYLKKGSGVPAREDLRNP
jgi:hypothetical protein